MSNCWYTPTLKCCLCFSFCGSITHSQLLKAYHVTISLVNSSNCHLTAYKFLTKQNFLVLKYFFKKLLVFFSVDWNKFDTWGKISEKNKREWVYMVTRSLCFMTLDTVCSFIHFKIWEEFKGLVWLYRIYILKWTKSYFKLMFNLMELTTSEKKINMNITTFISY